VKVSEEDYLAHYGILRKSGRYPWGSGDNPSQRSKTFLDILDTHRKEGLSEAKIAELYSTEMIRSQLRIFVLSSRDR
jgi:hypothetical protein